MGTRRQVLALAARSHFTAIRNLEYDLHQGRASHGFVAGQTAGLTAAVATLFGVDEDRAWKSVRRLAFARFYRAYPAYCCPTCHMPGGGPTCAEQGHEPVPAYQ